MSTPRISVVVPTYQRAALLDRCLSALAASDVDTFEVVVVDDGSTDDTPGVLTRHAGSLPLTALRAPVNAGPAAARNRGVAAARSELVLFVDDDVVVTPELLRRHVDLHAVDPDPLRCVLGRVDWHPDLTVTRFMRWLDRSGLQFAYDTWLREGPVDPPYAAFYTANLSLRRELLVAAGGFDERFPSPAFEDMELAFRLHARGLTMIYHPAAQAFHARSIDLATFRDRMGMVARSAAVLRQVTPDFPLDDLDLRRHAVRRRELLRLAATARVRRRPADVDAWFWAEVATAYVRG